MCAVEAYPGLHFFGSPRLTPPYGLLTERKILHIFILEMKKESALSPQSPVYPDEA
jgi:hypothetical protein